MPSIHIPEDDFGLLVSQTGSYTAAKERVKELVSEAVTDG